MGKGKGHQAGAFASKKLRFSYQKEWQAQVPSSRRRIRRKNTTSTTEEPKERPRVRIRNLRGMLEERHFMDRAEVMDQQQKRKRNVDGKRLPPGWIFTFDNGSFSRIVDDSHGSRRQRCGGSCRIPSLQELCLQRLAPVLDDYVQALGRDVVHKYLGSLSSDALQDLSIQVSMSNGLNDDTLYCLAHHVHIKGLCIQPQQTQHDEYYDDDGDKMHPAKLLCQESLLRDLLPKFDWLRIVPDSWEDEEQKQDSNDVGFNTAIEDWNGGTCTRLKRLELAYMLHLDLATCEALLPKLGGSGLTHLSLRGSLTWETGPDVIWHLREWCPALQVLDVSCCGAWMTEGLVKCLLLDFPRLKLRLQHCLLATEQVALELAYPKNVIVSEEQGLLLVGGRLLLGSK
uniref:Uncharacterized protein n=1 Tax=Grammatophora oceanica TaxID=210454 RepID=A0A7S1USJ0_9STRA|mmetsp:Transcript_17857/g.26440  ORF Transcript_17857/g.26440 Transcript_17857/m.26440 type:complete len:399 (+) Transcript_17857:61-1257(+)